jgi:hypothetical protein
MAHPGGKPTMYTKELAEEICIEISTSGHGLKRLCQLNTGWPTRKTIHMWRIKNEEFGDMYTKARLNQIECLVDDCLDIADDTSRDTIINNAGNEVCNSEYVNRSRLRVDTRKWLASKLVPRIYGDKKELSGDINLNDTTQKISQHKETYGSEYGFKG